MDAQDPGNPSKSPPPDPGHPPLTLATIRNPDLLRATLQGRAPTTPLGWYRLQEDWTKLTVKALRDLTNPGNGLHEAIIDLEPWRARKHTQSQHVWIPHIEWGQALTHDTDINVTRRRTVRLRRAPAEKDHPADANRLEQWEQATAQTRDTALRAAGLRTPDDNLPPPTYRQPPAPAGGLGYSPRARALLRDSRYGYVPWPAMARQRDRHQASPRDRPTRGSKGPHHHAQGPQGCHPARG